MIDYMGHVPLRPLPWSEKDVAAAIEEDESRWQDLFAIQARRLLDALEETADGPLWTQDLNTEGSRYLGAVHGYAAI